MARPKFPSDNADRLMLRLPSGMRQKIAEAAKARGRSMNAEIIARLEGSFDTKAGALLTTAEAEAYVEQSRLVFKDTFRSALEASAARMRQILLNDPNLLMSGLPLLDVKMIEPEEAKGPSKRQSSSKKRRQ